MQTFLAEDTKATLLLCGMFDSKCTEKPLSLGEYTRLVHWLKEAKLRPRDLLEKEPRHAACLGANLHAERIDTLLGRALQLGFAVEEWQRYGIWVLGRSDADYPMRYKVSLKDKAPPLLFGVGDRALLQGGGLGIVGSRNVDETGEKFTRQIATLCVQNHMPVVSGGAKGVDHIAMQTALESGGYTIGILADNLLKRSVERMNRNAIAHGSLLFLTPYSPNMSFAPWAAMERNKLIYAMADFGVVVSADYEKGGTWTGAVEELKREHGRSIFVRHDNSAPLGNKKLMNLGAIAWPNEAASQDLVQQLQELSAQKKKDNEHAEPSLFDFLAPQEKKPAPEMQKKSTQEKGNKETHAPIEKTYISTATSDKCASNKSNTIYDLVLPIIMETLQGAKKPLTAEEIALQLDIHKTQLNIWLKKALGDKKVQKLTKPIRYTFFA